MLPLQSTDVLKTSLAAAAVVAALTSNQPAHAVEPGVGLEAAWEFLQLPGTQFGVIKKNFNGGGGTVDTIKNNNGKFYGGRLDLALGAPASQIAGQTLAMGVKGFLSGYGASNGTDTCKSPTLPPGPSPVATFCTVMPLFDPNTSGGYPAAFNTVYDTPGETITYTSRRRVSHWGAAFELETPSSGAKTAPALAWKAGPAFRRIGQDFDLNSKGINLAGTSTGIANYSETLNTSYWGGYVGLIGKLRPAKGLSFTLDGEVGLYGAHTEYNGRYAASGATESGNPGANLSQSLALDRNTLAVIAALKLSAEQDFGALRLGAFVRGEYYSYAPSVAYNDTDLTGGVGQNLVGANNGTSLRNSNAFTFSTGARITVPLSQP